MCYEFYDFMGLPQTELEFQHEVSVQILIQNCNKQQYVIHKVPVMK